jgi:hypothetical protein
VPQKKKIVLETPPSVLAALNRLIGEGRMTIEELSKWLLDNHGIDIPRSTMGRHVQDINEEIADLNRSRDITQAFVAELGEDLTSDVSRLQVEQMHALTLDWVRAERSRLSKAAEAGEPSIVIPKELMTMARTLKDLMQTSRFNADLRDTIRKEVAAEMKDSVAQAATAAGIGQDVQEQLLAAMGVKKEPA